MTEKHSPLPWMADPDERPGYEWNIHIVREAAPHMRICFMSNGEESEANAALIVRAVNGLPEVIAALEDLHQKAGAVATWLNHWDVSFASEGEWRGPTGDGQLFFDALNRAAAVLTKLKG